MAKTKKKAGPKGRAQVKSNKPNIAARTKVQRKSGLKAVKATVAKSKKPAAKPKGAGKAEKKPGTSAKAAAAPGTKPRPVEKALTEVEPELDDLDDEEIAEDMELGEDELDEEMGEDEELPLDDEDEDVEFLDKNDDILGSGRDDYDER